MRSAKTGFVVNLILVGVFWLFCPKYSFGQDLFVKGSFGLIPKYEQPNPIGPVPPDYLVTSAVGVRYPEFFSWYLSADFGGQQYLKLQSILFNCDFRLNGSDFYEPSLFCGIGADFSLFNLDNLVGVGAQFGIENTFRISKDLAAFIDLKGYVGTNEFGLTNARYVYSTDVPIVQIGLQKFL